jgi:hypothetical protein
VPSPQKTAFEQESLHGRPPVSSEPVPFDTPREEKTIPRSTTQGNQPPTFSPPLYEENEKVGGYKEPEAFSPEKPIELPFTDDYYRDEAEMSEGGDVYEFETPKDMQPLPPQDLTSRTLENGGNRDTKEPKRTETLTRSSNNSDSIADLTAKTKVEMDRLRWSNERGRDYLIKTYNKRSRSMLTEQEFLDFLSYLQAQPTPDD